MTDSIEREATWQELARLAHENPTVEVGYSLNSGRAYMRFPGELVWANFGGVRLADHSHTPGATYLASARLDASVRQMAEEQRERLAAMDPESRAAAEDVIRRRRQMPDPEDWRVDRVLERQGRA